MESHGKNEEEDDMGAETIRVAINGYGVIGKRVADAVALMDDMTVAGVSDVAADYRVRAAVERGYPLFASTAAAEEAMGAAGLAVKGRLEDLLAVTDVVVDCTPKEVAAKNRDLYAAKTVKAIFQGGETHALAGYSFVAQVNYAGALGRDTLRVVSCNTTGLCRIAHGFHARGLIRKLRAVLVRRGTDPWESHAGGLINTIEPEPHVPSHQGPDAQTVMPGLPVVTMAAKGPFTLSHLHFAMIETTRPVAREEAVGILRETPRVAFVRARDGVVALNSVIGVARDPGDDRARTGRCEIDRQDGRDARHAEGARSRHGPMTGTRRDGERIDHVGRSTHRGGAEMRTRWTLIALTVVGLTLAPVIAGAQTAPGGSMGPGMRGGMGQMPGGMGMGGMMQMQGMMQQMQGMMQHMADMLKGGAMSPEQMKQMGEMMERMAGQMGETHAMMGGMGAAGRDPRAMQERMAGMQQHMADMQKHMAGMMGSMPSASPPATPEKK